eukprot:Blabericola_migrator_1__7969@NODE_408_length_8774_cov_256_148501_g321_i0_p3_GENE_NODE_408_length_8774_cov_256_148501_g321_i0NODE_408_length_8774_cov_256_148501_g321_i0_p3_ORF_typecomplete_len323_score32_69Mito_fiss_reg/PF05308_11/0_002ZapB/PF06005_12/0_01Myosin_tail_1/PF01576_19/0_028TTKRSYEDQ/PF10212_9/0_053HOOK/PF05622_12/0_053Rootletin/PF15035_6/0_099HAP1_N/PF04849_13/0_13CAP_N/PF01213_19/0_16Chibby/PF14645_6/0_28SpoVAD/PF07451_11/0_36TSC22/PF01166_18/0_96TSC22/PF01166_18/1_4e02PRIMA1/PF16101
MMQYGSYLIPPKIPDGHALMSCSRPYNPGGNNSPILAGDSSTSGSSIIEPENAVCWDIETYRLVTKRVEDLERENRMLRNKVVVMAAENNALRERLESEANGGGSLTRLLDQLRDNSNAGHIDMESTAVAPPPPPPPPMPPHFIPCDYDHVFRDDSAQANRWPSAEAQTGAKQTTMWEAEEPKFWDIQSVISGNLMGDRIVSQLQAQLPPIDDATNEYDTTMPWKSGNSQPSCGRLNEHGAYLQIPFNSEMDQNGTNGRYEDFFRRELGAAGSTSSPIGAESLPDNLLRRRTRRRGRRGGKKHGGRRKKQEGCAVGMPAAAM